MGSLIRRGLSVALIVAAVCEAARQDYDVRKIVEAFRTPHDDLTLLCAHRGLRWNGTTENSANAYFRAAQAGLECIETDIRLSKDHYLPMLHDSGLGRETDVGEQTGSPAYNPFTGKGYNPPIAESNYKGFMEHLHLRDEIGRTHFETVQTLPGMVKIIHDTGVNVVLQLDFKDQAAVEVAYWELKNLTNAAGVPANEWCIYKVQAAWWPFPSDFEAEPWVQDAFANGIRLTHIPVYSPENEDDFDVVESAKAYSKTNYTISAEINRRMNGGPLQELVDYIRTLDRRNSSFASYGIFYANGDFVEQFTTELTRFDTGRFTLPDDIRIDGRFSSYSEDGEPTLFDADDHRTDLAWIVDEGNNWIIADAPDVIAAQFMKEGKRNTTHLLQSCMPYKDGQENGWYRRGLRN